MPMMITFGDVFNYYEKDYVFLAKTEGIIYTAQILDKENSYHIKKQFNKISKNSKESYRLRQNKLYCFVELQTEEFKERVAHYGYPDQNDSQDFFNNIISSLNIEDKTKLHKELLEDTIFVPEILRELIKDYKIGN
jgi:hypothetical protein